MRDMEIALRAAAECIESNKRHLESMGRNCTVGTGQVLDEIENVLRSPNDQAHLPPDSGGGAQNKGTK